MTDNFVIVEGGLVSNDPSVPVFDLDVLDSDHIVDERDAVSQLFGQLRDFAGGVQRPLPSSLAAAIIRTGKAISRIYDLDHQNGAEAYLQVFTEELLDELEFFRADLSYIDTDGSSQLAQLHARQVLGALDIKVAPTTKVVLTDTTISGHPGAVAVSPGQIEAGGEQLRLISGDQIDTDALVDALPWV